jgi:hypothetical protein
MRLLNRVCILDRRTNEIIWEFGEGKALGHPHSSSALKNGNILLFDNGLHRCSSDPSISLADFAASRVIEINPKSNEIVWKYQDPFSPNFFSAICAGAQRLPNNNTLICEATKGKIFEVTYDKEIVWEYKSPFRISRPNYWGWTISATIWQAHRYPPSYPAFKNRNLETDRYEWVFQEKTKESKEKEEILKRLKSLGY